MMMNSKLRIVQPRNRIYALGLAVRIMFDLPAFTGLRFGNWTGMVAGQIERGQYFFALDGEDVQGYAGWGELNGDVLEEWLAGRRDPTYAECIGGKILTVFAWCARSPEINRFMWLKIEERALDLDGVVFLRRYPSGRKRVVRFGWSDARRRRVRSRLDGAA